MKHMECWGAQTKNQCADSEEQWGVSQECVGRPPHNIQTPVICYCKSYKPPPPHTKPI